VQDLVFEGDREPAFHQAKLAAEKAGCAVINERCDLDHAKFIVRGFTDSTQVKFAEYEAGTWQVHVRQAGSLELLCVRHSETLNDQALCGGVDDRLSPSGTQAAQEKAITEEWLSAACTVDQILISPLSCGIKTALCLFDTPELAARRREMGKPAVKLVIAPAVRELDSRQGNGNPLFWRHVGQTYGELTQDPALQPSHGASIDWTSWSLTAGITQRTEWWDGKNVTYEERVGGISQLLHGMHCEAKRVGGMRVACVAHEGFFRCLIGVTAMAPLEHLECRVISEPSPLLSPCRHAGLEDAQTTIKALPIRLQQAAHSCRDVVAVLGCSDPAEARRRMAHGVRLRREKGCCLVWVGAAGEFDDCLQIVNEGMSKSEHSQYASHKAAIEANQASLVRFSEEEKAWTVLDQCSRVTECNIDHLRAAIEAMGLERDPTVHIVTNDWHVARSMLICEHYNTQVEKPMTMVAAGCTYSGTDDYMTAGHMLDGTILASRVLQAPGVKYWKPEFIATHAVELQSVRRNIQRWVNENGNSNGITAEHRKQLRELIKSKNRYGVISMLTRGYRKMGLPLAHCKLNEHNGSQALHYAASAGAFEICHDLLFFFGASLDANQEGRTVLDFAGEQQEATKLREWARLLEPET